MHGLRQTMSELLEKNKMDNEPAPDKPITETVDASIDTMDTSQGVFIICFYRAA